MKAATATLGDTVRYLPGVSGKDGYGYIIFAETVAPGKVDVPTARRRKEWVEVGNRCLDCASGVVRSFGKFKTGTSDASGPPISPRGGNYIKSLLQEGPPIYPFNFLAKKKTRTKDRFQREGTGFAADGVRQYSRTLRWSKRGILSESVILLVVGAVA
jgi:hypothetical protein